MLRRSARAVGHLLTGLLIGPVAFAWAVATTLACGLLAVTFLGPPAFRAATSITRCLARLERARAGRLLGAAIPDPYEPAVPGGPWSRGRAMMREPATWRDLSWLVLAFPLGVGGGLVTVAAVFGLGLATAPAWLWAVPNRHPPPVVDVLVTTVPGRFALVVPGLLLVLLVLWVARVLARTQARIAASLLGAGPREHLARRAAELAATRRRVVDAQAAELRRIERDLHDGAQARIVAAGMTLALADRKLRTTGRPDDPARTELLTARRQLDEALAELRRLVRGIYPPILTDRGLAAALAALAGDAPLPVGVRADDIGVLDPAVESAAYFVVAEALANAVKHAAARECVVEVERRSDGVLRVEVRDDGGGGADPAGAGLDGLRRRVEALDGTMAVVSPRGGPTVVRVELPCAS